MTPDQTRPQPAHARQPEAAATTGRRSRYHVIIALLAVVTVVTAIVTLSAGQTNRDPLANASPTTTLVSGYAPTVRALLSSTFTFPGKAVSLPLPHVGQATIEVAGVGVMASTRRQRCVPVASVTKIMTAYLILQDHPIGNGNGPTFTMTEADHQAWIKDSENGDSNVEVKKGERLDERQLLEALMIPSADNIADYLGAWDAGSDQAFVAKVNSTAKALGLGCTHFADDSGISPLSESTAASMAKLGAIAMQNPTLRWITSRIHITLPVTGEIWNAYDPAVGVDGIVGVKSGFTVAADLCLVTAAWRSLDGHRVLVVVSVTGQPTNTWGAGIENEGLLAEATKALRLAVVVPAGTVVAKVGAGWTSSTVPVASAAGALSVVGWPGLTVSRSIVAFPPKHGVAGWGTGTVVAKIEVSGAFGPLASAPASLEGRIPPMPAGWAPPG
jgi:D-alanyl-D-alanine carboxypeptidase (penicillin-binding protein 5/6)